MFAVGDWPDRTFQTVPNSAPATRCTCGAASASWGSLSRMAAFTGLRRTISRNSPAVRLATRPVFQASNASAAGDVRLGGGEVDGGVEQRRVEPSVRDGDA